MCRVRRFAAFQCYLHNRQSWCSRYHLARQRTAPLTEPTRNPTPPTQSCGSSVMPFSWRAGNSTTAPLAQQWHREWGLSRKSKRVQHRVERPEAHALHAVRDVRDRDDWSRQRRATVTRGPGAALPAGATATSELVSPYGSRPEYIAEAPTLRIERTPWEFARCSKSCRAQAPASLSVGSAPPPCANEPRVGTREQRSCA
jgi:hypothetical protein